MTVRFVNVSLPTAAENAICDHVALLIVGLNWPEAEISDTTRFLSCWRTSAASMPADPLMERTPEAESSPLSAATTTLMLG